MEAAQDSPSTVSSGAASHSALDIGRLDRLSLSYLHLLLFVILGLGLLFDQMESSMTAVLTAVYSAPGSGVSAAALGNMIFLYYAIGSAGAPLLGFMADRMGRRRTLVLAFAGFGFLSALSALMLDFNGFAALRISSSILLTAVPALVYSYAADVLPAQVRGRMIMLISVMAAIGGMLAPGLTHVANRLEPLGLEGWRAVMLGGGIAGILLALCFTYAPESPRWLWSRKRHAEAEAGLLRFERSPTLRHSAAETYAHVAPAAGPDLPDPSQGLLSRTFRGRLALVIALNFVLSVALTGFAVLLTTSFVRKGFAMQDALANSALVLLAMPVGVIAASAITDRFDRRTLFVAMSLVTAGSSVMFGYAVQTWALVGSGLLFAFVMAPISTVMQIYSAEMFPTGLRGTAMGWGYAALRLGSACVPLLLLPALLELGATTVFNAIALLLLVAGLLARAFGPPIPPQSALA